MVRNFTKSDLRTGDVVVSRGGWQGVVLKGTAHGDVIKWFKDEHGRIIQKYRLLYTVSEDLSYDKTRIVKVYRCTDPGLFTTCDVVQNQCLYWEDTTREMTVADIEKALGYKVKIVK